MTLFYLIFLFEHKIPKYNSLVQGTNYIPNFHLLKNPLCSVEKIHCEK